MDEVTHREGPSPSTANGVADESVATTADLVACWRCGKPMRLDGTICPICRAAPRHLPPANAGIDAVDAWPAAGGAPLPTGPLASYDAGRAPIVTVLYFFLGLLCLSILQGAAARVLLSTDRFHGDVGQALRGLTTLFEAMDSVLVALAIYFTARPPAVPPEMRAPRIVGWLAGMLLLAVALVLNLAYHALLNDYLAVPEAWQENKSVMGASVTWLVLAMCLQPAIVEELFFRYLTLGHLRGVMGVHGAVWVSSLIFGLAHLGVPLSIPILIIVGVALGYARVWSGSLLLPMLMHAAHNGIVVYLETHP